MGKYDVGILGDGPFPEYVQFHFNQLNGRDPVVVCRQARLRYDQLILGLSDAQLMTPEKPDKWSIAGVFRHMVDTELVFVYRMKLACTVDRPSVPSVEADVWAKALNYWSVDPQQAIAAYHAQNEDTTSWYSSLPDELKIREYDHEEMGLQSVALAFHILASHDELHLKQVERIRDSLI
jgi:hypothetical protein